MQRILALAAALMLLFSLATPLPVQAVASDEVAFGCDNLEAAVKTALLNIKDSDYEDKEEAVTIEHMEKLINLSINVKGEQGKITCLDGLEHAANLKKFHLINNDYDNLDYSPLTALDKLQEIRLHNVNLATADLAVLAEISGLKSLYLASIAGITDFTPLGYIKGLTHLYLINMGLGDLPTEAFAFLGELEDLHWLELQKNGLADLGFLSHYGSGMESLWKIILDNNDLRETDLSPLLDLNPDNKLRWIYLRNCKLDFSDPAVKSVIEQLDDKVTVVPALATELSLTKTSFSLEVGQWFKLGDYAQAEPGWASLTWSSDDNSVAKVDGNGKVYAQGVGTATITVSSGSLTATCIVIVTAKDDDKEEDDKKPDEEKPDDKEQDEKEDKESDDQQDEDKQGPEEDVTSLALSPQRLTMLTGSHKQLTAKVRPDDAPLTWTSDDEDVATVDQDGKVTAHSPGTVTITVAAGDWEATCTITVKPDSPGEKLSIKLDQQEMHILSLPASRIRTDSTVEISHLNLLLHIPTSAWQGAIDYLGIKEYDDVEIVIESFAPQSQDKLQPVGTAYRFQLLLHNQPVSNFDGFLTLNFSYDPNKVENPDKLAVYWFNPETEQWVKLDSQVDKENHVVSAQVDHWSSFALMADTTRASKLGWYIIGAMALVMAAILAAVWQYRTGTAPR